VREYSRLAADIRLLPLLSSVVPSRRRNAIRLATETQSKSLKWSPYLQRREEYADRTLRFYDQTFFHRNRSS